ncbi:MAG: hypothetical protein V4712_15185 [Pseudomonadota bacterium]
MFRHTSREKGIWRGWLENDQSLELYWGGPTTVAFRVLVHSNDADQGDRMLNISLGFAQAFIPLGISKRFYQCGEEPQWGFDLSREFGIVLNWGRHRKHWEWPFHSFTFRYEQEDEDGVWRSILGRGEAGHGPKEETHPYTYVLKSGEVQHRSATIHRTRHVLARHILHRFGWPRRTLNSIDVRFSDEVGERSGSWKGGCIGCSFAMKPGEVPIDTLRRMERERTF